MREGDVVHAGIVFVGSTIGAGITGFSRLDVGLTVAWIFAATLIYSEHCKFR
jgi:hypothetical protein